MPIETGMYFTANNKKRLSFQEKFQQALDEKCFDEMLLLCVLFF
jgi:hypothetical protein